MSHDPRNDRADIGTDMHDPLCRVAWIFPVSKLCMDCVIIAEARADERKKAAQRVGDLFVDLRESKSKNNRRVYDNIIATVRGES